MRTQRPVITTRLVILFRVTTLSLAIPLLIPIPQTMSRPMLTAPAGEKDAGGRMNMNGASTGNIRFRMKVASRLV